MKTLLIGAAAAGLVGVTAAAAQSSSGQSSTTTSPSSQSSTTTSPSGQSSTTTSPSSQSSTTTSPSDKTSASQSASSQTGTTASAGSELSGEVKKVDKDKQSVKISSPTSGDQELKIGPGATIMRDGTQASLDQVKEGDQVRASFDPSSKQATKLEVQSKSKDTKDKQGSSKSDSKSDSKKY